MNMPNTAGESFPVSTSAFPVRPGGKLSNASQETSTALPTRGFRSAMRSWTRTPPVSLPTTVTSVSSSRSSNSATMSAMPRIERSAPGPIGTVCAPSGSTGITHRYVVPSSSTTPDHSAGSMSSPCRSRTTGPSPPVSTYSMAPAVTWTFSMSVPLPVSP